MCSKNRSTHPLHALIIGVGGSIYTGTVHQLTKLGVNGRDLKNTVRTVHMKTTEIVRFLVVQRSPYVHA